MFEKTKSSTSFASMPSTFKKLEWKLAEELARLEERTAVRKDEEFEEKLLALVDEYSVDQATLIAAVRTGVSLVE